MKGALKAFIKELSVIQDLINVIFAIIIITIITLILCIDIYETTCKYTKILMRNKI